MLFEITIHSSGDNHIDVYLSLDDDVFASTGKIILMFFPIIDKKSLWLAILELAVVSGSELDQVYEDYAPPHLRVSLESFRHRPVC